MFRMPKVSPSDVGHVRYDLPQKPHATAQVVLDGVFYGYVQKRYFDVVFAEATRDQVLPRRLADGS